MGEGFDSAVSSLPLLPKVRFGIYIFSKRSEQPQYYDRVSNISKRKHDWAVLRFDDLSLLIFTIMFGVVHEVAIHLKSCRGFTCPDFGVYVTSLLRI